MKKLITLVVCIVIPLGVGGLAGLAPSGSENEWYASLNKPFFSPPNWIFGPVWTLLYLLMGISLYIVWTSPSSKIKKTALKIFSVQLILNFAWSFIFFYFHEIGYALFELALLWLFILVMVVVFYKIKKIAAYLQIPYLLWVSYAAILNAVIWWMN